MPNASQMRCRDATDGVIFFRNQEEIVVCAMPDSNDNRYSVHPRSFLIGEFALVQSCHHPFRILYTKIRLAFNPFSRIISTIIRIRKAESKSTQIGNDFRCLRAF